MRWWRILSRIRMSMGTFFLATFVKTTTRRMVLKKRMEDEVEPHLLRALTAALRSWAWTQLLRWRYRRWRWGWNLSLVKSNWPQADRFCSWWYCHRRVWTQTGWHRCSSNDDIFLGWPAEPGAERRGTGESSKAFELWWERLALATNWPEVMDGYRSGWQMAT